MKPSDCLKAFWVMWSPARNNDLWNYINHRANVINIWACVTSNITCDGLSWYETPCGMWRACVAWSYLWYGIANVAYYVRLIRRVANLVTMWLIYLWAWSVWPVNRAYVIVYFSARPNINNMAHVHVTCELYVMVVSPNRQKELNENHINIYKLI
jgi:hypothetical protein